MSDHMLEIDFDGQKWSTPRIVPYHNFSLDPAASVFHYATEVSFFFFLIFVNVFDHHWASLGIIEHH